MSCHYASCVWCDEPVLAGESFPHLLNLQNAHRECVVRMLFGSSAHQLGRCSCFGGSCDELTDTKRDEAFRAMLTFRQLHPQDAAPGVIH